jgi:phytoene synthase
MPSSPPQRYEKGSSFSPAFFFLGRERRRALSALYGYARTVDDIADDPGASPAEKETALASWKARLEALYDGGTPQGPLETELAWAARTFSLNKGNLLLLLEGVGMDARQREYAAFEDLKYYMYRVASAVGLSCLEIFGWRGETAAAYAENLGYAVQLTNILRDVFEDAQIGRIYIPAEDFKAAGCDASALRNSVYPEKFTELMELEASRARGFYSAAEALADGPEKKSIFSARVMAQLYSDLLTKLAARGFRTAGARISLNKFEKGRAMYRAWRKLC